MKMALVMGAYTKLSSTFLLRIKIKNHLNLNYLKMHLVICKNNINFLRELKLMVFVRLG